MPINKSNETSSTSRWRLISQPSRGGHRFFTDSEAPGKLAIADMSGPTPDKTEDGILYVDMDRRILITVGDSILVPLISETGKRSQTPVSIRELRVLENFWNMKVNLEPQN
jgi:hypothetical protein